MDWYKDYNRNHKRHERVFKEGFTMYDYIRNKCDLFADNYIELNRKLSWNYTSNIRLGAFFYAMENRKVDIDGIKRCRKIIKDNSGVFSGFRDTTFLTIAVMLSIRQEPELIFQRTVNIYKEMRKEGFWSSAYLSIAALFIALQVEKSEEHRMIVQTKKYYHAMKENHRFITSYDDYGFAALLAISDKSLDVTIRDMEECFHILKESFHSLNSVQSLSHVLVFGEEDAKYKCKRVVEIYQALKKRKCRFGTSYELPFLGVIALLSKDSDKIADEIAELNQYLKKKKGFGSWSMTNRERLMYAAAFVCEQYVTELKNSTMEFSLANSITGIVIAQQMAMVAASSAAVAASSSAAN